MRSASQAVQVAMQPVLSSSPNSALPLPAKKPVADALLRAAGLLIVTPDGDALFLRYTSDHDHGGEWGIPAGGLEGDETPDVAVIRETREETGWIPQGKIKQVDDSEHDGVDFTTYATVSQNQFIPELSDEHDSWCWAPLDDPPEPLHPGLRGTLITLLDRIDAAQDSEFKESEHPREHGKFASSEGGTTQTRKEQQSTKKERQLAMMRARMEKVREQQTRDESFSKDSYNASASTKSELRDTIKFPPDKAPEAARAINVAYTNGGTTGGAAKQSVETNKFINSGGATRRDRMRAKRQQAVLDEFRESDHPRDHGKFASAGGAASGKSEGTRSHVDNFIKSGQAKQAISAAATKVLGAAKEHQKELLAGTVTFSLYHLVGADFPMDVEAAIHSQIEHLSTNLGVAKLFAISIMKSAVSGLQGLHTKGAVDAEDDISTALANLMEILDKLGQSYAKDEALTKIDRSAFLYLEDSDEPNFAQCGTCWLFNKDRHRCGILHLDFEVNAEDSCGYYLEGVPSDISSAEPVNPEDVGFVKATKVRCENCEYGGDECQLYKYLNKAFPRSFKLDTKINSRGCCNAFQSSNHG